MNLTVIQINYGFYEFFHNLMQECSTKYKNILSKDYTKNWSREVFIIDSVLKTNPLGRNRKLL